MAVKTIVEISGDDIQEISSGLGAPLIKTLDWGCDSEDYIRTNVAKRVLRIFFRYFPIKLDKQYVINNVFEIDYPDDALVYRVFRHFFNYKTEGMQNLSNPFFLQTQVLDRRSHPHLRPYHMNEIFSRLSTNEAMVNHAHALDVWDSPQERKVRGSTTTYGTLSIQWAKYSLNFNQIPFNYKDDAIKLGKAFLIQDASRIRGAAKIPGSSVDLDENPLLKDSDRWEEEVITLWKASGSVAIVK